MSARAAVVVLLLASTAHADDAATAFRDAEARAATGDPQAIDQLERLGAQRPVGAWTDDAWSEAARLAAAAGDLARERRDLEQVVATGSDPQLVRRARAELDRLAQVAGAGGEWGEVAATHDRLVAGVFGHGDPRPALASLEALVSDHPAYPRATAVRLAIARGWERDGDGERALRWYRDALRLAPGPDVATARIALVRALIARGGLAEARAELVRVSDAHIAQALAGELAVAEHRRLLRRLLAGALLAVASALIALLRRDAGSWRGALSALARPPVEALYLAPVAAVLVAVSWTGNPLVAGAIRVIMAAGLAITWVSGASLEAARGRGRRIGPVRAIAQAVLAAAAVGATAYLAISSSQLIDMAAETARNGPAPR